jgi:N-acyl-D-aspartate/D-glutamate deacylase
MADYDLVIRGGTIADGTGGDLTEGDVAMTGGQIAAPARAPAGWCAAAVTGWQRRAARSPHRAPRRSRAAG